MPKFIIRPHFGLHEWVAEEKGYFAAQGLDYEFREQMKSGAARNHHLGDKEFPVRFHDVMDTRRWGPGERLVFEPYSKEVFEESFKWIAEQAIFPEGKMGSGNYEESVISLAAD